MKTGNPATRSETRWLVSQIGARQHYGVPRGFHYKGHLRHFYTDVWCRWGHSLLRRGSKTLRALAGRQHLELPSEKVTAFSVSSILADRSFRASTTIEEQYDFHRWFGAAFADKVTRRIQRLPLDPERDCFFGFNTGCLETIDYLRTLQIPTVVDQIDPARYEEDLVFQEVAKWPGWQKAPGRIPQEYYDRLGAEWAAADLVLVNSRWSKQALIAQGVPAKKLVVTPVAFEPSSPVVVKRRNDGDEPLAVLWLGTVNLRKGIQYLIAAAQTLANENVRFIVAGPLAISEDALKTAPANMTFLGQVNRADAEDCYRNADVFVLPTISDGFAITQIEAMAQGLPVITTPNCGEVVEHGIDGVIVPAADSANLASAIYKLERDRALLRDMSYFASRKAQTFHLPRQADEIEFAINQLRR